MYTKLTSLFTALLIFAGFGFAQAQDLPMGQQPADADVSDEELENFVDVYIEYQELQQELQPQMLQLIEDAGLDVQTFQEISQSQQMGASAEDMDATQEELDAFDEAMGEIEEVEQEAMGDFFEDQQEMNEERFEEIFMALNQDPELMEKAEEMIMEKQGMPQQQQQAPPQNQ